MGLSYEAILWNKAKKKYDKVIALMSVIYLLTFAILTIVFNENTSLETLIIRAFGSLAIITLHIILCIGPLARLNPRFLPFLYNRRHLGVSMFLMVAVHGIFSIIQFHTLANVNPLVSLFTSNLDYASLTNFPFQVLGFFALLIFFVMAATSHDFWLENLGPKYWKALHMMVYLGYFLVLLHVFLGAFQQETSPILIGSIVLGMLLLISLHLLAAFKESRIDSGLTKSEEQWQYVCEVSEINDDRAKVFSFGEERIAIFKYENKLSAISNVCKHQGGPLGEGKIIDGCVTCPWHGYQYLPHNGQSPPPFTEKVATFQLKLEDKKVFINPTPNPEGTEVEPVTF